MLEDGGLFERRQDPRDPLERRELGFLGEAGVEVGAIDEGRYANQNEALGLRLA